MDPDHHAVVSQNDVRPSGETFDVEPEAPAKGAKGTADEQLGLGTLTPDLRHPEVRRGRDRIAHGDSHDPEPGAGRDSARLVLTNRSILHHGCQV